MKLEQSKGLIDPDSRVVMEEFSHLVGKLLTIIEASTFDRQQRKGVKDMVQEAVYSCRNEILRKLGGERSDKA